MQATPLSGGQLFFFYDVSINQLLCGDRSQHKAGAKNQGEAERDLVLIKGIFSTFCPLKRCEAGKE